ncbi:unnamed protein product [Closterium sp. NIES-54]
MPNRPGLDGTLFAPICPPAPTLAIPMPPPPIPIPALPIPIPPLPIPATPPPTPPISPLRTSGRKGL